MNTSPSSPRVVVIVINWNGKKDTLPCLASLQRVNYPAFEVLVVDNGSADDSVAAIRAEFPGVTLMETGQNLGFVGGNNVGLAYAREAQAEYALLLNNDTEVAPDFLTCMVATAESAPDVGIVGPAIYYYSAPDTFWTVGGEIRWSRGDTCMTGDNQLDRGQFGSQPRPVDFVTGCALLIRMSAVERAGQLDPQFFAYYEETEWCVRVARQGYRILVEPRAKVWHKISQTAREASPAVQYYMTRNRLLFLRLVGAGWRPWLRTLLDYSRTLLAWTIKPRWRGKAPQRRAMWQAINDYRRGRFGKMETGRA